MKDRIVQIVFTPAGTLYGLSENGMLYERDYVPETGPEWSVLMDSPEHQNGS